VVLECRHTILLTLSLSAPDSLTSDGHTHSPATAPVEMRSVNDYVRPPELQTDNECATLLAPGATIDPAHMHRQLIDSSGAVNVLMYDRAPAPLTSDMTTAINQAQVPPPTSMLTSRITTDLPCTLPRITALPDYHPMSTVVDHIPSMNDSQFSMMTGD